jgi:hypothetical protein
MLRDIAVCATNQGWFSYHEMRSSLRQLLTAAHQQTGKYEIPQ